MNIVIACLSSHASIQASLEFRKCLASFPFIYKVNLFSGFLQNYSFHYIAAKSFIPLYTFTLITQHIFPTVFEPSSTYLFGPQYFLYVEWLKTK